MFAPNLGRMRSQLAILNEKKAASAGATPTKDQRQKTNYLEVPSGQEVVFYVLPPWKADGDLARPQYNVYLAPIAKRHTAWKTYDPSLADQDPVSQVLITARQRGVNVKEVATFSTKFYLNAVVVARGPAGRPTSVAPEAGVIALTTTVWNVLLGAVVEDPSILEPSRASPFRLSRTGLGIETIWSLVQCGSVSPDGFVAHRTDVAKKYPDLLEHWERPLNLDEIWFLGTPVKQASRLSAEALAEKMDLPMPPDTASARGEL